jgi:lipase chaperone LimK
MRAAPREQVGDRVIEALANGQFVALIEQSLAHSGSADRAQAMIEARTSLLKTVPPHLHDRALDLLRRYVEYGEDSMTLPAADIGNLNAMRNMLAMRDVMRQKFFTAAEIEGLFGEQTRHDQFFVRKLELQQQADLTTEQRRIAIETAEQTLLTGAQRAARKEAVAHLDASAQTDAMNAHSVSTELRFVEREQSYGPEAAARLAQLDDETRRWNMLLDQYARASSDTREQLRKSSFTAEEVLRLDAAIELRQQRTARKTNS